MQTLSLDSRAPVERWSGHCQRLEEKLEEGRGKEEERKRSEDTRS